MSASQGGPLYKIRDWDERFENSASRKIKNPTWVPVPAGQSGDGKTWLLAQPTGEACYGAFVSILGMAMTSDIRGTLVRPNGLPHDAVSISRITRFSVETIQQTISLCLNKELQWLEAVGDTATASDADAIAGGADAKPGESPTGTEQKGREGKGREGKARTPPRVGNPDDAFHLGPAEEFAKATGWSYGESTKAVDLSRVVEVIRALEALGVTMDAALIEKHAKPGMKPWEFKELVLNAGRALPPDPNAGRLAKTMLENQAEKLASFTAKGGPMGAWFKAAGLHALDEIEVKKLLPKAREWMKKQPSVVALLEGLT